MSDATQPAEEPSMTTDEMKLLHFLRQAVSGPFMAMYRITGEIPRNANQLHYLFAKYLNDIRLEVISEAEKDPFVKDVFENVTKNHSIDCLLLILFNIGIEVINALVSITLDHSIDVSSMRQIVYQVIASAGPKSLSGLLEHTCHGVSISELKTEIQNGTYTPLFSFGAAPAVQATNHPVDSHQ